MTNKNRKWYADKYIGKYEMKLVPLGAASKLPKEKNWGDTETPADYWEHYPADNIGLNLGESGYCSLDIDCLESFKTILEEFDIPMSDFDGFPTIKGASKGKRILFKMPEGFTLPYVKLNWPRKDDPKKHFTVFELRASEAGGKARQDVLPPSIHPDTKEPYIWEVQPRSPWPAPPDVLVAIWSAWESFKPQMKAACPWVTPEPLYVPITRPRDHATDSTGAQKVQDAYESAYDLAGSLVTYGYIKRGKRYLSPHSGTNLPGVILFPDGQTCWIHHASDPLCSEETGQPVNSFDLYVHYDHGGDRKAAIKQAAKDLGIKQERPKRDPIPFDVPQQTEPPAPQQHDECDMRAFKALGYNGTSYYYLPRGTEQVSEIRRASQTSPAELMSLAPLEWWEMAYPKEKGGVDWQLAGNDLMRACEKAGIYSQERERGRGAWHDAGRSVLHLGDRLLVDGHHSTIHDIDTKYIYTRQAPLESRKQAISATDEAAAKVTEIMQGLNWSNATHANLLAGWCFLAPICGALKWRPHLWITAQRGAGKSWVQDHIIGPLLGPSAMMVQGSTTEAGIRQRLKQDARPIVFDEAESEDQHSQKRMQTVIELARQSSSDSTAEIVKGTAGGQGMAFRMRSMFLLGSINVGLSHAADESRFSVLTLAAPEKSPDEIERFDKYSKMVDNTLTDELCAQIRARAYHLMPVIRHNAKVLSRAVAELLGSQRLGDQTGTLLAGDYCLRHSDMLTIETAREWVSDMDFTEAKEAESVSDEEKCLKAIVEQQIHFDTERGSIKRSIGELIQIASGIEESHFMTHSAANSILKRYGLLVDEGRLMVANNHSELEKLMKNTPWANGWRRVLCRIEGAKASSQAVRYAGTRSRAICVPVSELF